MNSEEHIDIEKDVNIHLENKSVSRHFFVFLWIMYAVVVMTKNCYNGAMASIVSEGILTKSQTGFITAMFYLVYTPLQIAGGMFADRFSPERMIKIGLVGAALSNAVIFFNQSYYVMLAAWVFNGIIQFAIWPSTFKIISSQLVRSDRKSMAFYMSFATNGGFILSYLTAALVTHWEYNFAISAVALLVLAVSMHIYTIHLNPYMKWDKNVASTANVNNSIRETGNSLFKASGFYMVFVVVILTILVSQSRSSLAPIMFVENYDYVSPAIGNSLNIFMIVSGMAGTLIAGRIASKVSNELKALAIAYIIMIPIISICIFVGKLPIPAIVICLCVVAALEAFATLMRTNYTMEFARYGKSGTAAGVLNAGMAFSFMLSAYAMTRVIELFGWTVLTILWPILIATSAVILFFAISKYKRFKAAENMEK